MPPEPSPLQARTMGAPQRAELLDQTNWTRGFSWDELLILAQHSNTFMAPEGAWICREGDKEAFLAVIVTGRAAIHKRTLDGSAKRIGEMGPGRSFGEMSIFDREPRSASVEAIEDTLLIVMTLAEFEALVESRARVALKLVLEVARLQSQRLRQRSGQVAENM